MVGLYCVCACACASSCYVCSCVISLVSYPDDSNFKPSTQGENLHLCSRLLVNLSDFCSTAVMFNKYVLKIMSIKQKITTNLRSSVGQWTDV